MTTLPVIRIGAVEDESILQSFGHISDRTVVLVVAFLFAGKDAMQRVMEVIVPLRIHAVATSFAAQNIARIVEIAFRDQEEMLADVRRERIDFGRELLDEVNG